MAAPTAQLESESAQDLQSTAQSSEQALIPAGDRSSWPRRILPDGPVSRLPVELEVSVPLRDFRVLNLLSLDAGVVVASQWAHGDDVPLCAGDVQLAWAEFEVADHRLAVRLTRLA